MDRKNVSGACRRKRFLSLRGLNYTIFILILGVYCIIIETNRARKQQESCISCCTRKGLVTIHGKTRITL